MRSLSKLLAAFAVSVAVAGCAKPSPDHWAGLMRPEVLEKVNLQYYWELPLVLEKGETVRRLYLLDENLYCLTSSNRLIAVDAAKGIPKWSYELAEEHQTVFRPCHAEKVTLSEEVEGLRELISGEPSGPVKTFDAVMFNTLKDLLVLDRTTGRLVRKIRFDFVAGAGGTTDGAYFYVGSTHGWYRAIRLQEAIHVWTLPVGGLSTAPVEHHGGRLYIAGGDGNFYVITAGRKRKQLWPLVGARSTGPMMDGPVTTEFHVDERGCFVPCEDYRLYKYALSGERLWRFVCEGPLRDPVQVGRNTVFQFARRDKFYAINPLSGEPRWSMPDGRLVLAVAGTDVYLLGNGRTLFLIDEILGKVRTSVPMTGFDLFVGNATAAVIYTARRDGRIFCLRPLDAGHLKPEMLRKTPS